ncbi:MAG: hypothetical protein H6917_18090 [Novosphingobium sp.]|nr:hypothetical protein [Hyphomonas sp.]MCB2075002.1 hypothetical protein [Novosphingobium sp.]MCP5404288.1 hypothetical protein [Novosphingobium sp.]
MISGKIVLTVLAGGTLMGLAGQAIVPTTMKPAPERPWQKMMERNAAPTIASYEFVEAGPVDLDPQRDPMPWHRHRRPLMVYPVDPVMDDYGAIETDFGPVPAGDPAPDVVEYRSAALPRPVGEQVATLSAPEQLEPAAYNAPTDRARTAAEAAQDAAIDVAQALADTRKALAGL